MKLVASMVVWTVISGGLAAPVAQAQPSAIVAQHTTWLVKKGSQDFISIRAFLLAQSGPSAPYAAANVDTTRLGDLTVQYATSGSGSFTNSQENPPAYPPNGPGAQPGDTWSVSSCINGEAQSWGWTAQPNGNGGVVWVMSSYSDQKGVKCGPNTKSPPPSGR